MRTLSIVPVLAALAALPSPLAAQRDSAEMDSATVLPPVVVTVDRTTDALRRVPAAVSVLTGDAIALGRPGLTLSEALVAVPGVSIKNRFNASRDDAIAIRGFGARAAFGIRGVRILLDGIPLTLPDGQGQLTNVDLARIERIEVLRGAASALYGNAAGGVISLWSRTDPVPRVVPEARLVIGDFGTTAAHVGLLAPLGRGHASLRVGRTATDGFRRQSAAETWQGSLHVSRPLGGRTRVIAHGHVSSSPLLEDPGALNAAERDSSPTAAHPGFAAIDARKDLNQVLGGVTVEHRLPAGARVSVTGFGVRRDLVNVLPFAVINLERWAWGARSETTVPLASLPGLPVVTAGVDLQWQRDDRVNRDAGSGAVTRDQLERVREIGPFVQVRLTPLRRVAVTTGVRWDAVRFAADDRLLSDGDESGARTLSAGSWTAGLALDVAPLLAPYANVGTAFETPTTTELANQPDGSDGFNPALEPQRATQMELGVRGGIPQFRYAVAAFHTTVRDELIPFEAPGGSGRTFFRNAGRSRHRGLEFETALRPVRGLELGAAYTQTDFTFTQFATDDQVFDGNTVPGVPERFVTGTLRAEGLGLWLFTETRASSRVPVDDANSAFADGWWVTDVRLGYRFPVQTRRLDVWVGVENVFDERYVSSVAVNAGFGRFYEPGRPRAFFVGGEIR